MISEKRKIREAIKKNVKLWLFAEVMGGGGGRGRERAQDKMQGPHLLSGSLP